MLRELKQELNAICKQFQLENAHQSAMQSTIADKKLSEKWFVEKTLDAFEEYRTIMRFGFIPR